jgi:starvation-inducible DNA-binding protein
MESHIDLPEGTRSSLVEHLTTVVAGNLQLWLLAKMAHWNLKGPEFSSLHELFDEVAHHLRDQGDVVAERAAALGAYLKTDAASLATHTPIPPFERHVRDGLELAGEVAARMAAHADAIREAIPEIADPATEHLLADLVHQLEKDVWMLESHLQEEVDEEIVEEEAPGRESA